MYLRIRAPHDAEPGVYRGTVSFKSGGKTIKELPYEVRVWNFTLPDRPEIAAIFDNRYGAGRQYKSYSEMDSARFLAKSRISLDEIPQNRSSRLENGEVVADFTEFDKAARLWFDERNVPLAYLPVFREHFGWGHPPKSFLGVAPYPGKYPYPGVDRGRFTAEYPAGLPVGSAAYDESPARKGLEDRFLLYIADEPHAKTPGVVEQMSALCDMFHEAWPGVRIYSSTWGYVPECVVALCLGHRRTRADFCWGHGDAQKVRRKAPDYD